MQSHTTEIMDSVLFFLHIANKYTIMTTRYIYVIKYAFNHSINIYENKFLKPAVAA